MIFRFDVRGAVAKTSCIVQGHVWVKRPYFIRQRVRGQPEGKLQRKTVWVCSRCGYTWDDHQEGKPEA